MTRPPVFNIGLIALCTAIALQATSTFFVPSSLWFWNGLLASLALSLPHLVAGFLAYKIAVGRNWARITLLVWFLLLVLPMGMVKSVPFVLGLVNGQLGAIHWRFQVASGLTALSLFLQVVSLYVFFSKPSSLRFKATRP